MEGRNGPPYQRKSASPYEGQIFNIEGQKIFTFGGGESTDKDIRAEQGLYWKEELPTPAEMAEGAAKLDEAGLEVDYIITHEPPKLVKSAMLLREGEVDRINKLNGYFEEIDNSCNYNDYVDVETWQSLISTANSLNSQTITKGN